MGDYLLNVNGLPVQATYFDEDVRNVLMPLLRKITTLKGSVGRRPIVFLAGPPAMGKSTLGLFLEKLAEDNPELRGIQCVGMDGFHYSNRYLETHTTLRDGHEISLRAIKGAPETFDAGHLDCLLREKDPVFPYYDRRIHESVPDMIRITKDILLVEGNWLLLDSQPWNALPYDLRILIVPEDPEVLINRAVARKIAGGFDPDDARAFVERSDRRNILYCLEHSTGEDIRIMVRANGRMEVVK